MGTLERMQRKFQYGLNTPDGVIMVVLMVEDTLKQNMGLSAMAVDGENVFNSAKKAGYPGQVIYYFPTTSRICRNVGFGSLSLVVLYE